MLSPLSLSVVRILLKFIMLELSVFFVKYQQLVLMVLYIIVRLVLVLCLLLVIVTFVMAIIGIPVGHGQDMVFF